MEELIKELEKKVTEVKVDCWYFQDTVKEFIELAHKAKIGNNLEYLLIKYNKIVGYIWALDDLHIITGKFRNDFIGLCSDITSQSIFQE